MPLSINVGLSRKASKDFQSSGVSINLTAELDQALLARPLQLQQQINQLYAQAEQALSQQSDAMREGPAPLEDQHPRPPDRSRLPSDRHGRGDADGGGSAPVGADPMTASQRRAIGAIAQRIGAGAADEARRIIGVDLEELSVRQASNLIDHLQTIARSANAQTPRALPIIRPRT